MIPCWSVRKLCHGRWLHDESRIIVHVVIRRRQGVRQNLIIKIFSIISKADASSFPTCWLGLNSLALRFVHRLMNYRNNWIHVHSATLWIKGLNIFKASSKCPFRRRGRIKIGSKLLIITTLVDQTGKISGESWHRFLLDVWMLRETLSLYLFHFCQSLPNYFYIK